MSLRKQLRDRQSVAFSRWRLAANRESRRLHAAKRTFRNVLQRASRRFNTKDMHVAWCRWRTFTRQRYVMELTFGKLAPRSMVYQAFHLWTRNVSDARSRENACRSILRALRAAHRLEVTRLLQRAWTTWREHNTHQTELSKQSKQYAKFNALKVVFAVTFKANQSLKKGAFHQLRVHSDAHRIRLRQHEQLRHFLYRSIRHTFLRCFNGWVLYVARRQKQRRDVIKLVNHVAAAMSNTRLVSHAFWTWRECTTTGALVGRVNQNALHLGCRILARLIRNSDHTSLRMAWSTWKHLVTNLRGVEAVLKNATLRVKRRKLTCALVKWKAFALDGRIGLERQLWNESLMKRTIRQCYFYNLRCGWSRWVHADRVIQTRIVAVAAGTQKLSHVVQTRRGYRLRALYARWVSSMKADRVEQDARARVGRSLARWIRGRSAEFQGDVFAHWKRETEHHVARRKRARELCTRLIRSTRSALLIILHRRFSVWKTVLRVGQQQDRQVTSHKATLKLVLLNRDLVGRCLGSAFLHWKVVLRNSRLVGRLAQLRKRFLLRDAWERLQVHHGRGRALLKIISRVSAVHVTMQFLAFVEWREFSDRARRRDVVVLSAFRKLAIHHERVLADAWHRLCVETRVVAFLQRRSGLVRRHVARIAVKKVAPSVRRATLHECFAAIKQEAFVGPLRNRLRSTRADLASFETALASSTRQVKVAQKNLAIAEATSAKARDETAKANHAQNLAQSSASRTRQQLLRISLAHVFSSWKRVVIGKVERLDMAKMCRRRVKLQRLFSTWCVFTTAQRTRSAKQRARLQLEREHLLVVKAVLFHRWKSTRAQSLANAALEEQDNHHQIVLSELAGARKLVARVSMESLKRLIVVSWRCATVVQLAQRQRRCVAVAKCLETRSWVATQQQLVFRVWKLGTMVHCQHHEAVREWARREEALQTRHLAEVRFHALTRVSNIATGVMQKCKFRHWTLLTKQHRTLRRLVVRRVRGMLTFSFSRLADAATISRVYADRHAYHSQVGRTRRLEWAFRAWRAQCRSMATSTAVVRCFDAWKAFCAKQRPQQLRVAMNGWVRYVELKRGARVVGDRAEHVHLASRFERWRTLLEQSRCARKHATHHLMDRAFAQWKTAPQAATTLRAVLRRILTSARKRSIRASLFVWRCRVLQQDCSRLRVKQMESRRAAALLRWGTVLTLIKRRKIVSAFSRWVQMCNFDIRVEQHCTSALRQRRKLCVAVHFGAWKGACRADRAFRMSVRNMRVASFLQQKANTQKAIVFRLWKTRVQRRKVRSELARQLASAMARCVGRQQRRVKQHWFGRWKAWRAKAWRIEVGLKLLRRVVLGVQRCTLKRWWRDWLRRDGAMVAVLRREAEASTVPQSAVDDSMSALDVPGISPPNADPDVVHVNSDILARVTHGVQILARATRGHSKSMSVKLSFGTWKTSALHAKVLSANRQIEACKRRLDEQSNELLRKEEALAMLSSKQQVWKSAAHDLRAYEQQIKQSVHMIVHRQAQERAELKRATEQLQKQQSQPITEYKHAMVVYKEKLNDAIEISSELYENLNQNRCELSDERRTRQEMQRTVEDMESRLLDLQEEMYEFQLHTKARSALLHRKLEQSVQDNAHQTHMIEMLKKQVRILTHTKAA